MTKPQKTLILCIIFILGIASYILKIIPIMTILLLVFMVLSAYKKIITIKYSILCFVVAAFSIFYCAYKTEPIDALGKIAPDTVSIKGRVISEPVANSYGRTKFEFKVYSYQHKEKTLSGQTSQSLNKWKKTEANTIVNVYKNTQKLLVGDILELHGYVKTPYESTNPGQFDYKKYLKHQGIYTFINAKQKDLKIIEHPKSGYWYLIQKINLLKNLIVEKNRKYLKSPHLEIMEGMVLGDYAVPVPDEVKQEFIKSGLLHLLAASGMNVGFIFGFWFFFASILKIPHKPKLIIGMALIAFYSLLTGLPPSVLRAAVMAEFLLFGKLMDRKADSIILLFIVCAATLFFDPFLITNVSFQLSYLTTFGLLLCTQPLLEKTKPVPEFVSGVVLIPIIAQIWASPIQLFYFNNFAVYSVIANILVIPFTGVITYIGFIGNIFGLLPLAGQKICWLTAALSYPIISAVLFISGFFSKLPNALYYPVKPSLPEVILFYSFIIVLLHAIKADFSGKKLNIASAVLMLVLAAVVFSHKLDNRLKILVFDVGQGDGIYIHTPENKNFLVDTGPPGNYSAAAIAIIPYLRSKGINELDGIVLTHFDSDHIGGTVQILKSIKVRTVFTNDVHDDSKCSRKLTRYLDENNINTRVLTSGQKINFDKNININVIRAKKTDEKSDNEDSLILYFVYKDFSALLMADSEADSLYEIKKYVKKPVDFIKIGHHGSYNSVNYSFLEYLKPELAVVSVGKRGYKYGHPNKQVLKDLSDFDVKTLRTDKDFAITINSNGNGYSWETYKKQKSR